MARTISPPEGFTHWVIATGFTSKDFKARGAGPCSIDDESDADNLRWFKSERQASGHPAVIAHGRTTEIDIQIARLEQLKNPQAYSAKGFDAWRWRQQFPTQEASDAEDFADHAESFKDMAVDIEVDELTPWEASGAILDAIQTNIREVEHYRKTTKKQLQESIPREN